MCRGETIRLPRVELTQDGRRRYHLGATPPGDRQPRSAPLRQPAAINRAAHISGPPEPSRRNGRPIEPQARPDLTGPRYSDHLGTRHIEQGVAVALDQPSVPSQGIVRSPIPSRSHCSGTTGEDARPNRTSDCSHGFGQNRGEGIEPGS